jgi:hypothetical protein
VNELVPLKVTMATTTDPLEQFIAGISFRFLEPEQRLPKGHGGLRQFLSWFGVYLDALNTRLPPQYPEVRQRLRPALRIPRMSTVAVGAIVNQAVALMPESQAYLNIGVWNGFTFLSAVAGNADKTCIGVDNFCKFGGPREAFEKRFARLRSPKHHFHDMDYEEYIRNVHREQIGVYYFDGPHTYAHQFHGLRNAEPFFAPDCVVIVDDTNGDAAQRGTLDFIAQSPNRYRMLLNQRTSRNCHPTFWNGIMLFRRVG